MTGTPPKGWDTWRAAVTRAEQIATALGTSAVFTNQQRPPDDQRGIYMFRENGAPLYVGRTGPTARHSTAGIDPVTSFRKRYDQHTQDATPPGAAQFARRLFLEAAAERGYGIPEKWFEKRLSPEQAHLGELWNDLKARIRSMDVLISPIPDADPRGVLSTLAEVCAHVVYGTPDNDFRTS